MALERHPVFGRPLSARRTQHFEEKTKGSLEPGKPADFEILSADPTAVKPEAFADNKDTETLKEGRTIFVRRPGAVVSVRGHPA
ncbi:amidohydrolase family protein [Sandaracinobacter sp.]|uniref:amidohydrolase family protein n=1 Tax=Sandaracinobacter sp. TaxID=2487581 RepID=UPI0035AD80C6